MCLRGNADRRKTPVQPCIDEKLPSLDSATKFLNHYDTVSRNSVKEGMHDITNQKIQLFLDFVHKRF